MSVRYQFKCLNGIAPHMAFRAVSQEYECTRGNKINLILYLSQVRTELEIKDFKVHWFLINNLQMT